MRARANTPVGHCRAIIEYTLCCHQALVKMFDLLVTASHTNVTGGLAACA
jgi:hypothetical protein